MLNILDRYILKNIINNILLTLFILTSLSSVVKFIEQLRKVGQGNYSILNAGTFTILNVFKDIEIFFPMSVLFGSILGLSLLEVHGELLIMQVCGFHQKRIFSLIIKLSIILIIWTFISNEWIIPIGKQISYRYQTKSILGENISQTKYDLWIKDNNNFIFIEKISNKNNNKLINVNIYNVDSSNKLKLIIFAKEANFNGKSWDLIKTIIINLNNLNKISMSKKMELKWEMNLTPDKLKVMKLKPDNLSISELYFIVNFLKKNNQEYKSYQLIMINKVLSPLLVSSMLAIPLLFISISNRKIFIRKRITIGIFLSFSFYILDKMTYLFIILYDISPIFSSFLPILVFFLVFFMIIKKRNISNML